MRQVLERVVYDSPDFAIVRVSPLRIQRFGPMPRRYIWGGEDDGLFVLRHEAAPQPGPEEGR